MFQKILNHLGLDPQLLANGRVREPGQPELPFAAWAATAVEHIAIGCYLAAREVLRAVSTPHGSSQLQPWDLIQDCDL
jgi:hypothetical protein